MSVHVGYSIWSAWISSDKVSDIEDTSVEAGNIDAVVWCSAIGLSSVCLCGLRLRTEVGLLGT